MKKVSYLCFAAMAALTMVSCSQDELTTNTTSQSQDAIGFDTYLGRNALGGANSRGSVNTVATIATSGFGVFAYPHTDSYTVGSSSFTPSLMNNVQVSGSTSESSSYTWTYSPLRYWPQSGYVGFLAYAPYSSTAYSLTDSNGKTDSGERIYLSGFEVNSTISSQVDLLWNTTNHLNETKPTSTDGKVKMTFAHALSRIGVSVTSSYAKDNTTISIQSISLSGAKNNTTTGAFYKSGMLKLTETSASTDLWSSTSTNDKLAFTLSSESNLQNTSLTTNKQTCTNKDDSYLMVIPQDFTYTDDGTPSLYLFMTYTVKTSSSSSSDSNASNDATITNTVTAPINQKFEAGKAYTLKISVGLLPIQFDVETSISGWDTPSDVEVNVN